MFFRNYSERLSERNREWWMKHIEDVRKMKREGKTLREIGAKHGVKETAIRRALVRFK